MNLARLIVRNTARNGYRSGIIFCCSLLLAAMPFGITFLTEGGRAGLHSAMDRLGADLLVVPENLAVKVETALLTGKPFPVWMARENLNKVARVPGVAQVSPQLYLATLSGASCCSASEMFIMAYDPATDFTLRPWLAQNLGRDLATNEVLGGSQIYPSDLQGNLLVYGTQLHLKGNLAHSGTGLDRTLFMTFETAREVARMSATRAMQKLTIPANEISAVLVKLEPGADPWSVANYIEHENSDILAIQSPQMVQSTRKEFTGLMRIIVLVVVLVWLLSIAVAGLVFSLAAHERRRELGVLRALGSSRGFVLRLLLGEAVILALTGAASGIALCLAIAYWFHDAIVYFLNIPFLFPPPAVLFTLILGGVLIATLSVMTAAFFPIWRASRMEPAQAMRE
jgi:putative ABC transport system permease protein